MLYNGGLYINTTMNREIQEIMEAVWADNSGWPTISGYRTDKSGNIIGDNGKLMLYSKSVMFDDDGDFVLEPDEFEWQGNGDLKLLADKRLNFFKTSSGNGTDYSIEFKSMYEKADGLLYSIEGGSWAIASEYKTRDDNGDMMILPSLAKKCCARSSGPQKRLRAGHDRRQKRGRQAALQQSDRTAPAGILHQADLRLQHRAAGRRRRQGRLHRRHAPRRQTCGAGRQTLAEELVCRLLGHQEHALLHRTVHQHHRGPVLSADGSPVVRGPAAGHGHHEHRRKRHRQRPERFRACARRHDQGHLASGDVRRLRDVRQLRRLHGALLLHDRDHEEGRYRPAEGSDHQTGHERRGGVHHARHAAHHRDERPVQQREDRVPALRGQDRYDVRQLRPVVLRTDSAADRYGLDGQRREHLAARVFRHRRQDVGEGHEGRRRDV